MKKITILFMWLLLPLSLLAQQLENTATTYTQESTIALAPLLTADADIYKNSILYDRVMPLANLREVGTTIETHSEHFKRAWQELYDARMQSTDKHIAIKELQQIANHYQKQGIIPVGVLNIDFTQFKTNTLQALEEDNITINQLANRNRTTSNSPYVHKHLFLASPIVAGSIKTPANTPVNFELGTLGVNQAAQSITTLQVIYNNITKTIVQNGALTQANFSFSFASSGVKTLQFKATYTSGKQLISNAKVNVTIQHVTHRNGTPIIIPATQPFQGYDEPANCGGTCYGEGEYEVFLGKDNTNLQKPLIILDGFDPGDARKINNGKGSIVYLIDNNDKEPNMQKFYDAGFDVVILNFPNYLIGTKNIRVWLPFGNLFIDIPVETYRDGGADYIERNANVLKALIVKLNTELQQNGSAEKLKIIGPSMGGLISRVALTQMEKANQNHNTDIWVSFDSPHLGANIPIGLQYFFNFMELDQVEMLKSPAARQMLLTQVVEQTYTTRNTFKNLLNSLGFPQQTRNLALINGSINGTRQGTPKGTMLDIDAKIVKTLVGSLGKYQIKTFASHDGGRHKIFERYKRFLFFKNTKSAYLIDNSGNGSLDNSPGGTFDMKNEFESFLGITLPLTNSNSGDALNALLNVTDKPARFMVRYLVPLVLFRLNSSIYLNLHQGSPAFIPTKSSLAFNGTNKQWHENIGSRNLVCTGETPFDSYFAPTENEPHITLNAKNMAWLTKELKGIEQQPTVYAKPITLTSPTFICYSNPSTLYTNNDASCGKDIIWSVSSNIQIVASNNNQITVSAVNVKTYGSATITATIKDTNNTITKNVWVGIPPNNNLVIRSLGGYNVSAQRWTQLDAHYSNLSNGGWNLFDFEWNIPNSQTRISPGGSLASIYPLSSGQMYIKARAKNTCGCSDWKSQLFSIVPNTSGGGGKDVIPQF